MQGQPLSEFELEGRRVIDIAPEIHGAQYAMWATPLGEQTGFRAIAVEFVSMPDVDTEWWSFDETSVEELFSVTALFDGVRHLEWNREGNMPGYQYYPDMKALIGLLSRVAELETRYCDETSIG